MPEPLPRLPEHDITPVDRPRLHEVRSQFDDNVEFLGGTGELAQLLLPVYYKAVRAEPALADVRILKMLPSKDGKINQASARPAWKAKSGRHEVRISTEADALEEASKDLAHFSESAGYFADLIGVQPQEMSPELLVQFMLMHELGHTLLYKQYEHKPERYDALVKKNLSKLPVPLPNPAFLHTEEGAHYMRANWSSISKRLGIDEKEDFLKLMDKAHRAMPQEVFADKFAARILGGKQSRGRRLGKLLLSPNQVSHYK